MYQAFFKLTADPFAPAPDPRYIFPTASHERATAGLHHGVTSRAGVMALTGEAGTGKTLALQCLLRSLESERVALSFLYCHRLQGHDLLRSLLLRLNVCPLDNRKSALLLQLGFYLLQRKRKGLVTALIVDDVQDLGAEALGEVRLLADLAMADSRLLQVILCGHPERETCLDAYELRQLRQRTALRFQLMPLTPEQTASYIERRLHVAGRPGIGPFSEPAMERVHRYAAGIPRLINLLCSQSLMAACAQGTNTVASTLVDRVAAELRLDAKGRESRQLANRLRDLVSLPMTGTYDSPRASYFQPSLLIH